MRKSFRSLKVPKSSSVKFLPVLLIYTSFVVVWNLIGIDNRAVSIIIDSDLCWSLDIWTSVLSEKYWKFNQDERKFQFTPWLQVYKKGSFWLEPFRWFGHSRISCVLLFCYGYLHWWAHFPIWEKGTETTCVQSQDHDTSTRGSKNLCGQYG